MREIRPYGSARGVRRNPYPYRDTPPPDAAGGALLILPLPAHVGRARRPGHPPNPAPSDLNRPTLGTPIGPLIREPIGQLIGPESGADRRASTPRNQERIARAKWQGPRLGSTRGPSDGINRSMAAPGFRRSFFYFGQGPFILFAQRIEGEGLPL